MTSRRAWPSVRVATNSAARGPEPLAGELDIRHRRVGGTVVVEVAGEVDLDTAPQLEAAIVDCVDQAGDAPCVLDLAAVTFLGSCGLTVLLNATLRAQERQGRLAIVVDSNRPVIRPIAVTGLDEVLALYHTVDEAMHAHAR